MSRYHVLAGLPDNAEELRSLAVVEAGSGADALRLCLRDIDDDRVPRVGVVPPDVTEALERERQLLRQRLREPEMYFIVTAVEAEEHFVRDYDGEVRDATEVARRHSRIRGALGVDAL
jgi:hypothetical protein